MSALGSLVVKLGLEYAEFTGGLDKSEQAALASAKRVQDTFDGMKSKLAATAGAIAGGLAAGFTVAAFKNLIAGAIETGAAFDDLSMQTGASTAALRELAAIGKFNDMGPDQIGAAMNKLSANLAGATEESKGAGKALEALGLDFDTFRKMRPEDQMQTVAQAMSKFEDGTGKSAVAMALFGKEGAKMLPFMKDLADAEELSVKLTEEQIEAQKKLDAQAANLDDNLRRLSTSGEGWKKELANGMIPALDMGAQALLDMMNGTGGLRDEVKRLVADGSIKQWTTDAIKGLSYVADAGHIAWRVLQSIGKGLGGLAAALVQALQGDFRGAWTSLYESGRDMIDAFDGPTIGARFRESLDRVAASSDAAGGSAKKAALDYRNLGEAAKGAESEFDKLVKKLDDEVAKAHAEAEAAGRSYTKGQIEFLALADSPRWAKFTENERAIIAAKYAGKIASEQQEEALKRELKTAVDTSNARMELARKEADSIRQWFEQQDQAAAQSLTGVKERIVGLRDEAEALALSREKNISLAEAVEQLAIARLQEKQARLHEGSEGWQAIQKEIDARKELLGLVSGKAQREEEARGWADMWQSVDRTAHDVFVSVLEGGQDAFKRLGNTLKASVLDVLYQMTVRKWIINIGTSVFGAGFGAAAQAATGGAAAAGGAGNLLTAASLAGNSSFMMGLSGAWGAGGGLMSTLNAGASLLQTGTLSSITSGLGTIAGALGPIALGIGLLSSLIKKSTPHMGAASSYSAATGLVSGVDVYRASGLADTRTYSADAEKVTATVAQSIAQALDSTAVAFGKKAGYEISTAFADDKSKDGAWGSLIIKQMGEAVLNWQDTQTSKWAPKEFADGEAGAKEYQQALAKSVREVIDGMGLPEWAARITRALPESATMDDLTAALAQVQAAPAQLLQQFGTTRDEMVQQFAQGLASGNAASAGQAVADTLVASIQNAVFTNAAGQIFDTVNMGIVTPMLDAIATGASVADALSQATIDKTIERAKAQAQALAELYGNADFAAAMEQLRTAVGGALGQAGSYIQTLPQTLVATQQIDTAAQDAARAAEEAQRAWQQITDGLLADQATLQIELLRAQGREEEALARERALAIEGMDAYQTALYDSNRALRTQIDTLRELGELLPSVIDQYLTPEQRTANAYQSIAADLVAAGLSGAGVGDLAQALVGASKGEIAEAATAIYQMTGVTDEMRVALLRAAGSLATLKDEAASAASGGLDAAYSALERAVQARRSVVQDTVNDVRAVFDTVRSAARDLFGEVDSVVQFQADAGRAYITQALGAARSTGYLPDGEQLSEAIRAARAGLQGQVFASQAEADYQKLVLANELKALQDISGDQLTEAERQLKALDGILDSARAQIDALRGIDNSVMSVEAALAAFGNAVLAMSGKDASKGSAGAQAGKAGAGMPGWANFGVGDWMVNNGGSLVFDNSTGMLYGQGDVTSHRSELRDAAAALLEAGQNQQLYDAVRGSGFTLDQADTILGLPAGEAEKWARSLGLPVFHDGTPYVPRTGFAVLQQGEAVIPRAFNPFTGGGSSGSGNAELLAELRALREQNARLEAALNRIGGHSESTATALNSVVRNNALVVDTAPEF